MVGKATREGGGDATGVADAGAPHAANKIKPNATIRRSITLLPIFFSHDNASNPIAHECGMRK